MNFAFIAFFDTFDLVASLPERLGGFKGERARRVLTLCGPRTDDDPAFVDSAQFLRWPEAQNLVDRIRRLDEGIEFGRIHLEMLLPGHGTPWTREEGEYAERFSRAYLALRTNPGCRLICGGEMLELLPGNLTVINRRVLHSAVNWGDNPRINLVVDFKQKLPLPLPLPAGRTE